MSSTPLASVRPHDLLGAPELCAALGLVLAAAATGLTALLVPPPLGRALVPAALLVLGPIALVSAYALLMPWLARHERGGLWISRRYGDAIRRPLREVLLALGLGLALLLGLGLVYRFPLRGPDLCHPEATSLRAGPLGLGLLASLVLIRSALGRVRLAQRALFGGSHEGYLIRWSAWVGIFPLCALVTLFGYAMLRPARFVAHDQAAALLEELHNASEESIVGLLFEVAEPISATERIRHAGALLDAMACQPPATAGMLAERLLGPSGVVDGAVPATALRQEAVLLMQHRPWNVVGDHGTRLGALAPGDARAAARMEEIARVRDDRVAMRWAAQDGRCSGPRPQLSTDRLSLAEQERAWLYHSLCAADRMSAIERHGAWLDKRLPDTVLQDVGIWTLLGNERRIRRVRNSDWPSAEKLAQSPYAQALDDTEQLDTWLFGAQPRPLAPPCAPGLEGAVLHVWRPMPSGVAWAGALARLPKVARSGRARKLDAKRWMITAYRVPSSSGTCPSGWDGPHASTAERSIIGQLDEAQPPSRKAAARNRCVASPAIPRVCSFPAFVVEPAAAPDNDGATPVH